MTNQKIFDPEWFSDDPEVLVQLWEDHFANTYGSNWDALRVATSSSFVSAAHVFGLLLNSWQRGISGNQPAAETSIVLDVNYQTLVIGPLLATIIQSAFCLESLVRLVAELMLVTGADNNLTRQFAIEGFDCPALPKTIPDCFNAS